MDNPLPTEKTLIRRFIKQSNRIEGIFRQPKPAETDEFSRFMALDKITIDDLTKFVSVYQPDAQIRSKTGLNVQVGLHIPPPGGDLIIEELERILVLVNANYNAYDRHVEYETLHPFTDCNGRSGRMIWAWMVRDLRLQFLQRWYYDSLNKSREGGIFAGVIEGQDT